MQQISMEAALAAFEKKCGELLRANVLLEARAIELEQENEKLRAEQASAPTEEPSKSEGEEQGNGRHAAQETRLPSQQSR